MQPSRLLSTIGTLLGVRDLRRPDGRPLYAYRFSRDEYEEVGHLLKSLGSFIFEHDTASALLVAYVAEWFRRDRHGGHWDWIRPLAQLGIRYGSGVQDD